MTNPTTETEDVVGRLRADADRQDGEEESIVSTNCMRNAADLIQSLSERIAVLEAENADYRKTWELIEEMAEKRIEARAALGAENAER